MKRIVGLLGVNLFLIVVLGMIAPNFFTRSNLVVVVDNLALEAIALSGYTLLIVGGYFDLSIDGIVALTGVLAGIMMVIGIPWPISISIAMLCAGGVGYLNGFIVSRLKIPGFIATLTTWWACVGISLGLTKALAPYGFPEGFQALAQTRIFGFRSTVFYALVVIFVLSVVLHLTPMGSHIYLSGDNKQAAEMMGINVKLIGLSLYILMALLSGFIGLLLASRLNAASPVAVDGMALRVIAAVVIGGCSLSGGKGSIVAGLLGLLIMHILSNAVIQLGVSPYYQKALLGGILLVAILAERLNFMNNRRFENA